MFAMVKEAIRKSMAELCVRPCLQLWQLSVKCVLLVVCYRTVYFTMMDYMKYYHKLLVCTLCHNYAQV